MLENEVKIQTDRIKRYRELEMVRNQIADAIHRVTRSDPSGPCGQGPFTGNTRESRRVESMHIKFTATLGGAPPVDIVLSNLQIPASQLGRAVEKMLREKLAEFNSEMEKI